MEYAVTYGISQIDEAMLFLQGQRLSPCPYGIWNIDSTYKPAICCI
ncbi:MAG: hypothetical protein LH628_26920 [Microcoleus sp. CAN_BIN18]|nr:hypothetical protein [Microcoleus sp. CAN_BIN18]